MKLLRRKNGVKAKYEKYYSENPLKTIARKKKRKTKLKETQEEDNALP